MTDCIALLPESKQAASRPPFPRPESFPSGSPPVLVRVACESLALPKRRYSRSWENRRGAPGRVGVHQSRQNWPGVTRANRENAATNALVLR
jgi:hypothetical protein